MTNTVLAALPISRAFDASGLPLGGGLLFTYQAGSNVPQPTYADLTQNVLNSNPVVLDSTGTATIRYLPATAYKLVLTDKTGSTVLWSVDNYYPPDAISVAQTLNAITPSETAAGVTPNYIYPVGDVRRWGVVANNGAVAAANTAALLSMVSNRGDSGFAGDIWFPNVTGSDIYYFDDFIDFLPGISVDLCGSTLNFTKVGSPSNYDSNAGFVFAIRDFSICDGTIIANYSQSGSAYTNAGNCLTFGNRGTDSQYFSPLYDSLLAEPMGDIVVRNIRCTCNHAIGQPLFMIGGLQNVVLQNVVFDGGGVALQGLYYEFGWATNESDRSARQTSHANNFKILNMTVQNLAATGVAVTFNGAYNLDVDGLRGYGMASLFTASPGESMFYRPWTQVDDTGAKRGINLHNLVGGNLGSYGVDILGAQTPTASAGYLGESWEPNTAYILNATRVNSGNWYVVTAAGTSASSGGPTTTSSSITDGGVTWAYIPLSDWTELAEFTLESFSFKGTGASSTGYGVRTSAGRATVRDGTIQNMMRGIVTETECTLFNISGVKIINSQSFGVEIGLSNSFYSPARFSTGAIRSCYIVGSGQGGNCAAISGSQIDSLLLEGNRIGYETVHDGLAETTQTNAITVDSTCSGVVCRSNYVGSVASGVAYAQVGASSSNGNTIDRGAGITTLSGLWDSDLATISADRGDNNVAVTVGADYAVQLFNTPLSTNRTVTLNTTGAVVKGSKFRVVRTANSTGAFSISVGGLKSIPNSTAAFVDVEYTGSAWIETAYGTL